MPAWPSMVSCEQLRAMAWLGARHSAACMPKLRLGSTRWFRRCECTGYTRFLTSQAHTAQSWWLHSTREHHIYRRTRVRTADHCSTAPIVAAPRYPTNTPRAPNDYAEWRDDLRPYGAPCSCCWHHGTKRGYVVCMGREHPDALGSKAAHI